MLRAAGEKRGRRQTHEIERVEVDTELRDPLGNQLVDEVELETLAAATYLGKHGQAFSVAAAEERTSTSSLR